MHDVSHTNTSEPSKSEKQTLVANSTAFVWRLARLCSTRCSLRHEIGTLVNFAFMASLSVQVTLRAKTMCLLAFVDVRNIISSCLHFCCTNNRIIIPCTNKLECKNLFSKKGGVWINRVYKLSMVFTIPCPPAVLHCSSVCFPAYPPLGSSSSASSSDDEIKEVFESCKQRQVPTRAAFSSRSSRDMQGQVFPQTVDSNTNRPLRVVPSGHHKPKFFAQMAATASERPSLDFNKMQHSKRLLMVSVSMSVGTSCWPLWVQDGCHYFANSWLVACHY